MADVDLSAVASSLGVDASGLSLHNVQTSGGAATSTYVVSSGDDNYAVSVGSGGAVTLNTTEVDYTDTENGVASGVMTGVAVKVGADASGNAVGFVSVQGKNYSADTGTLDNGGDTANDATSSDVGDISATGNAKLYTGASTNDPLALLDKAIASVDTFRSSLGAVQNRLDSAITNLNNTTTNLSEAQSRIQDADYAVEVSNMSKAQIVQQAGNSVLAKANQVPQQVLSLLQG